MVGCDDDGADVFAAVHVHCTFVHCICVRCTCVRDAACAAYGLCYPYAIPGAAPRKQRVKYPGGIDAALLMRLRGL